MRLLNNFQSHLIKSKSRPGTNQSGQKVYTEVEPSSPSADALMYEQFVVNDTLTNLENKALLNPAYFDKDPQAFDFRVATKSELVPNTKIVKSAYWNKKTHFVLQKKVDDS